MFFFSKLIKIRKTNESYNLLSNLAKILGKSIWQMVIPFTLSLQAFNIYSLLQNITSVLIQTTNLGTRQVVLRHNSEEMPLMAFLMHSLLLLLLQIVAINFFFEITFFQNILISSLTLFTNSYFNYSARLKGLLDFKASFFVEIIGLLFFSSASLFLLSGVSFSTNLAMQLEILVLIIVSSYSIFRLKLLNDSSSFSFVGFDKFKSSIYRVGIISLSDTILWRFVPIYFLQKLSTNSLPYIGIFNLALLLGNAFVLIPQSLLESWIPSIAMEYRNDKNKFHLILKEKYKKYYFTLALVILIAILIISVSLKTIYVKYEFWYYPILIFAILRIISSIADIKVAILYAKHLEKLLIMPSLIGALSIVFFTVMLSKNFGFYGIITAYVISKFVFILAVLFNYKKSLSLVV
jgi:O-antigen/teichoic acid export membrane protein